MAFERMREKYKDGLVLDGGNMDRVTTEFHDLSEFYFRPEFQDSVNLTDEKKEAIKTVETWTKKCFDASEEVDDKEIKPLEIVDGKVDVKDGTIFHRVPSKSLEAIADGGVLASEWFGVPESAKEGCYCAFLSTENSQIRWAQSRPTNTNAILYYDGSHPIMQAILGMDYFEYEHIKKTNPEKLKEMYDEEVIKVMDTLVEPSSPYGRTMHDNPQKHYSCWHAVLGGVPSKFVNGVSINSTDLDSMARIEEIRKLYPNAVIFDEKRNVLARPLNEREEPKEK